MKSFKTLLVFGLAIGIMSSCNKKDDDSSSSPTNTDISGTYVGDLNISQARDFAAGTDSFFVTKITGNSYNITSNPIYDPFAEITVSGSSFTGKEANGSGIQNMKGSVSGSTLSFTANDDANAYSFTGTKTGGSGGNGGGNGFAGPAEYNTGSMNVTANGQQFTLGEASGGLMNGDLGIDAGDTSPAQNGELELVAKGISGPGTYDVTGYTWDEDRNTWDTIDATLSNALTITAVSETSISGSFSFSHSGLTIAGTFNLNK